MEILTTSNAGITIEQYEKYFRERSCRSNGCNGCDACSSRSSNSSRVAGADSDADRHDRTIASTVDCVEQWEEKTIALIFSAGGGGYAGGNLYSNYAGFAISGDWVLEPLSGVVNEWGIPCSLSDGWQCLGGVPKGTPAHELGHALGLPHPGSQYSGQTIMEWHGDYPSVGFLSQEIALLRESPFFQ